MRWLVEQDLPQNRHHRLANTDAFVIQAHTESLKVIVRQVLITTTITYKRITLISIKNSYDFEYLIIKDPINLTASSRTDIALSNNLIVIASLKASRKIRFLSSCEKYGGLI